MKKSTIARRALEILPGLMTWAALILPLPLSYVWPWVVAAFLLIFDLYWLYRSLRLAVNTIRTYRSMRYAQRVDWEVQLKEHYAKLSKDKALSASRLTYRDIYHVVILVHYKESYELLKSSVESYAESKVPKDRLWLILASEERGGEEAVETYRKLYQEYGHRFGHFIQTIHPAHIPGEIKCKSANATWAAKELKKILDKKKLSYQQVIVHNFDADTRVYHNYFNYVTYQYLRLPKNQPASFQPVHIYSNNIWDVPAMMRVVAQSSTLIFMHNMLRPAHFKHFSSRSDIFQTLVDINYWAVDFIPEDSREYYDTFFYYKAKLIVVPIYIPLRMDAVLAEGYWRTIQNQYRQLRRWAWGVAEFPDVVFRSIKDKQIPWYSKASKIIRLLENHFSWATSTFYITIFGWVLLQSNHEFSATVMGYNFPIFARYILSAALIGLITGLVLSFFLLPPRPPHKRPIHYFNFFWQWLLSPVVSIFLSAFAAIDAQTRLMFGKYMEYDVTEKAVVKTH